MAASGGNRRLDRVRDVALIQRGIDVRALRGDAGKVRPWIVVEDFVHLSVVQRGVKTSPEPVGAAAGLAAAGARQREQRCLELRGRKAHRAREVGAEQQEL